MRAIDLKINKAKELLASLIEQGVDTTVITAQKNVIKKLEKEASGIYIPANATVKVKEGNDDIKSYKICKATFQREIKYVRVQEFISLFKSNKYESAFPVIAITVAKAKSLGLNIFDFQGDDVTDIADENWIVIIDGQHRAIAAAILNEDGTQFNFENLVIKEEIGSLPEYLSTINGKEISNYSDADRLEILSIRDQDDELSKALFETVKMGVSQATAERIFTSKPIPRKKYSSAFINGEKLTILLSAKEKENLDIERGKKLCDAFLSVGIGVKKITRYWVEGFNSYAKASSEEQAFESLKKLKPDDIVNLSCGDDFVKALKIAFEMSVQDSATTSPTLQTIQE